MVAVATGRPVERPEAAAAVDIIQLAADPAAEVR
jgi:hypothetical protein